MRTNFTENQPDVVLLSHEDTPNISSISRPYPAKPITYVILYTTNINMYTRLSMPIQPDNNNNNKHARGQRQVSHARITHESDRRYLGVSCPSGFCLACLITTAVSAVYSVQVANMRQNPNQTLAKHGIAHIPSNVTRRNDLHNNPSHKYTVLIPYSMSMGRLPPAAPLRVFLSKKIYVRWMILFPYIQCYLNQNHEYYGDEYERVVKTLVALV
jgi:hypothetical protein